MQHDLLEGRTLRWKLKLQTFRFNVIYIKSEANSLADALSRLYHDDEIKHAEQTEEIGSIPSYVATTRAEKRKAEMKSDDEREIDPAELAMRTVLEAIEMHEKEEKENETGEESDDESNTRLPNAKVITDKIMQKQLIELFHNHPLAGHPGAVKGLMRLRQLYFFKGMAKQYREFVRNCDECRKFKHRNANPSAPLGTMEIPTEAFSQLFYDLTGPYEMSSSPENFKYVLTAQCITTNFVISTPIKSRDADVIAETLFESVMLRFGFPKKITSDLAPELAGDVLKKTNEIVKSEARLLYNLSRTIQLRRKI